MTVELFGALNKSGQVLSDCKISPAMLGGLVGLISDGTLGVLLRMYLLICSKPARMPRRLSTKKV